MPAELQQLFPSANQVSIDLDKRSQEILNLFRSLALNIIISTQYSVFSLKN